MLLIIIYNVLNKYPMIFCKSIFRNYLKINFKYNPILLMGISNQIIKHQIQII